ncbi:3606_t:CDS:2 [Diversispora eburnea]|uniref:6-phosphogluconolactonase n=1 Tax=Diversispora eburnea TaxID=1213867 RepID=A0A9N9BYL1_9GLOM|nr:3606_t:CDS:2 [Diversispora eburnea]
MKDSNYLLCQKELFDHVPIPPENIHIIKSDLVENIDLAYKSGETEKGEELAQEIVDDYENQLVSVFGSLNPVKYPVFDLLLLGLGPDGHTCSLFPDHPLLKETLWVGYIDNSPKPPSRRITFTLPVINHAHSIIFVATGENKQDILRKILDENNYDDLPAKLVKPSHGQVYWYLDQSAAAKLNF